MFSTRRYLLLLQVAVWLLSFTLFFFYLKQRLHTYPTAYVLGVTASSFASFAFIIYGYIFLYNRYFNKVKAATFIVFVLLLFLFVALLRIETENKVVAPLADGRNSIFYYGKVHWTYTLVSCFFALIVGILSKSFTEVIFLKTKQAEIQKKQLESELRQLKAQVQPHFLFNSLNSLYYDTYKALPDVAERLARLSAIMRYFIDESPKEKVPLSTEVTFIESYIDLEKIRLHSPIDIRMENSVENDVKIPPMLLIPLVENVFKHGIQNNGSTTKVDIQLKLEGKLLHFTVTNTLPNATAPNKRAGTGLKNLKERLDLLFDHNYSLSITNSEGYFTTTLIFPVYES